MSLGWVCLHSVCLGEERTNALAIRRKARISFKHGTFQVTDAHVSECIASTRGFHPYHHTKSTGLFFLAAYCLRVCSHLTLFLMLSFLLTIWTNSEMTPISEDVIPAEYNPQPDQHRYEMEQCQQVDDQIGFTVSYAAFQKASRGDALLAMGEFDDEG